MTNIEVCPWKPIDSAWLRHAIHEFLLANVARGGDLLPTSRNVSAYLKLGLDGAARGEPCLVAITSGEPVAFVLWVGTPSPALDSRWKTINALGSYTEPHARRSGVARRLREEAWAMTKALGYERVIGPMSLSNERGMREFIEVFDAWPTWATFEAFTHGR